MNCNFGRFIATLEEKAVGCCPLVCETFVQLLTSIFCVVQVCLFQLILWSLPPLDRQSRWWGVYVYAGEVAISVHRDY